MAVTYTYTGTDDTIVIDFTNQEINVGSGFDTLEVQEVNDAIREAEASAIGCAFSSICDTSGKESLDVTNGVTVGITLELLESWLIYSEKTSGTFRVIGGNLLQSGGGDPFKPNPLVTYINIQSAASTIVQVSTGSGLSTAEHNQLMAIPTETLTSAESTALDTINTNASAIAAKLPSATYLAGTENADGSINGASGSSQTGNPLVGWTADIPIPESGAYLTKIVLALSESPDSAPTISVQNASGTSRNANLSSTTMNHDGGDVYSVTYTADSDHAEEDLTAIIVKTEGGDADRLIGKARASKTAYKISNIYKGQRNKNEQEKTGETSGTITIYDDDGTTALWTRTIYSDPDTTIVGAMENAS
jgi:hypothetical protein